MIDLEKERDLFESKFKKSHWVEYDKKRNKYFCPYVADSEANKYDLMWQVWLSATNRGGYKLVKECDIKKTDQEIDQLIDERDTAQEKAEELKEKLQDLYGVDFGEHSNANCPFQNTIDYDDSGYKLVPIEDLKHIGALNKDIESADKEYLKEITSTTDRLIKAMIGANE